MESKYIDIHAHVNFKAFDEDRSAVMSRALDGDTFVINVGTQVSTSKKAVELAHEYEEGVYAIVGLHPIHTDASFHDGEELEGEEFNSRGEEFDKDIYRELLKDPKVVAIGECGLDYFHASGESIEKQKKAFIAQIELASEVGKPLMLHIRNNPKDKTKNAYSDSLELLKKYLNVKNLPVGRRGDVHFFAGNLEEAKAFLDFGFALSFTGVVTFTHDYDEVIKNTPLDMIMSETDSPYVSPIPYRGKRNEPSYVKEIVKKIAEIKGLPEIEVKDAIFANARRIFKI
jgi:TatD DNase family protein